MQGYRFAVAWIAENDETAETDLKAVSEQVTVLMLADMTGKDPEVVARDVLKARWNAPNVGTLPMPGAAIARSK